MFRVFDGLKLNFSKANEYAKVVTKKSGGASDEGSGAFKIGLDSSSEAYKLMRPIVKNSITGGASIGPVFEGVLSVSRDFGSETAPNTHAAAAASLQVRWKAMGGDGVL
jgi:hypothetical protein